jgi:ABC-type nitrate/sulfonate/bicarbonate transport system substrate-binding protein
VFTTCIALVAVLAAAGCGSSNSSSGSTSKSGHRTVTIALQNPGSAVPAYVALALGLYKDAGITGVTTKTFTALPALFAATQHGQVDVAYQTIPGVVNFNNATKTDKLLLLGAGPDNNFSWVATKGTDVPPAGDGSWEETVKAWKGKTVGVTALGGIIDLFTRYMGTQAGLTPGKDFSVDPIGAGAAAVGALSKGVVKVGAGEQTTVQGMTGTGGTVVLDLGKGWGPPELTNPELVTGSVSLASESAISKDKSFYSDYQAGYDKAKTKMADPANKSIVITAITKALGVDEAAATKLYPLITGDKQHLTESSYDATVKVFQTTGILKGTPPPYAEISANLS